MAPENTAITTQISSLLGESLDWRWKAIEDLAHQTSAFLSPWTIDNEIMMLGFA
jgi:hypothetical protein